MGAFGHCRNGVLRVRPGVLAEGADRSPSRHLRRLRASAGTLIRGALPRRLALALSLATVAPALRAQVPTDTAAQRDSILRQLPPLSPADSVRAGLVRPRADTFAVPLPSDTTTDTTKVPKDTLKAPLAVAELPPVLDIGQRYTWDRKRIYSSGAQTLFDLLRFVPGLTVFRPGWQPSEQHASYLGNPTRLRVFLDGMEMDPLDPRAGPTLDTYDVPIWSMENITLERGADEIRIYMRTWSVTRTTASTRVDVATGDLSTNLIRGFFGKRFKHGEALQLGAQTYGTSDDPNVGGGGDLGVFGRGGWAKGPFSADIFVYRSSLDRDAQTAGLPVAGLTNQTAQLSRVRTDLYLRLAYGVPDSGAWAQAMVGRESYDENSAFTAPGGATPADSADTARSVMQYVFAGGFTRWGLRLSATERLHDLPLGGTMSATSGRVSFERGFLGVSLYAEHRTDSSSTEEATFRLAPFRFFSFGGAITHRHGGSDTEGDGMSARGEVGIHIDRFTLTGGVMHRSATIVPPLPGLDTAFVAMPSAANTGWFGTVSGRIFRDLGVDIWGVRWEQPGFYLPQMQSREELYLDTKWLTRFPSGHFNLLASIGHEYRANVLFPVTGTTETLTQGNVVSVYNHLLVARLEIRILDVTAFYDATFGLAPAILEYVPGYLFSSQRAMYGIRWDFWN